MAVNEGLTGLVAELVQPIAVSQVKTHPRFKYFQDAGEDAYQSFLGVPLIDRGILQGVHGLFKPSKRVCSAMTRFACSAKLPPRWLPWSAKPALSIVSLPLCRSGSGRWRAIYGGVKVTTRPACSSILTQRAGMNSTTIPLPCSVSSRWPSLRIVLPS